MKTTVFKLMLLFSMAVSSACTKANPDACCENDAQCAALGVDGRRACENGQTCSPVTLACVAPECAANTDCDSTTPVCSNRICIAACHTNDDCTADAATPLCQTETGACVGCLDASACSAETPYCDANAHACRGCALDAECPSGVCIEADGVCAKPEQLLYVSSIGADTGDCVAAPCATLAYALKKTDEMRRVLRVTGIYTAEPVAVTFTHAVTLDGDGDTSFRANTEQPVFRLDTTVLGTVTIEGVSIDTVSSSRSVVAVGQGSSMRLWHVSFNDSSIKVDGSLDARRIDLRGNSSVSCTGGTLTLRDSALATSYVETSSCATTITATRAQHSEPVIRTTGGLVKLLNNVFVATSQYTDLVQVFTSAPGSVVAFNTFFNTASASQSPVALTCGPPLTVSSNIFAYNSTNPLNAECVAKASLFDMKGAADATPGNVVGDPSTFFRNAAAGDYHLAAKSPAVGLGEPGLVDVDFDGVARPSPTGSRPDAGAFEAR